MKKILLALLLGATLPSFGQVIKLQVTNASPCTMYFTLNISASAASCTTIGTSNLLVLPAGASMLYSVTAGNVPPFPASTRYITSANVYSSVPACSPSISVIGEPSTPCSYSTSLTGLTILKPDCSVCNNNISATWTQYVFPNGLSELKFN